MFDKKTILKKTIQIGWCTQLSRILGLIREVLMVRYLGASALSDAFFTAYKIPNALRKIFAEGALSAAFVPPMTKALQKHGQQSIAGFMSLAFLVFEGLCCIVVAFLIIYAPTIIPLIAPGFSPEQIQISVACLKIVMPLLLFISSSALLAGPLQATGHFFVPAFSQVLLNIVFIITLCLCILLQLSLHVLCWSIIVGGFLQFLLHLYTYFHYQFRFGTFVKDDVRNFVSLFCRFLLCLPSISVSEINLFIDTSFASVLTKGSLSLLYYANRFVGIPLGVFAVSFSTVLLPHFSRLYVRAPQRLSFYLFESIKFVLWIVIPVALMMGFFAEKIFHTIFLSEKFTILQVYDAYHILWAFLVGLFFFSINHILLNIYYALHVAWIPALVSMGTVCINLFFNWMFLHKLGVAGLALATSIAAMVRMILFLLILCKKFKFVFYGKKLFYFFCSYVVQLACAGFPCVVLYYGIEYSMHCYGSYWITEFFLYNVGLWLWVGPLCGLYFIILYWMRTLFNMRIFFLD